MRWQSDRAAFREFLRVGISSLLGVRDGEITADEALAKFENALGLLEGNDDGRDTTMSPVAPRPGR